jgi:hypothetical protein
VSLGDLLLGRLLARVVAPAEASGGVRRVGDLRTAAKEEGYHPGVHGRAGLRITTYRLPYHKLPADTPPPDLSLAQNPGMQDGGLFALWLPTLHAVRARGLRCAITMYDAGERDRALQFLSAAGFRALTKGPAVSHNGRNPFGSLFLGCVSGDVFSNNRLHTVPTCGREHARRESECAKQLELHTPHITTRRTHARTGHTDTQRRSPAQEHNTRH